MVMKGTHFRRVEMSHGTPDPTMEKEMRQALSTSLLDPSICLLNSVESCKKILHNLDPISPVILRALVDKPEEGTGIFSHEVAIETPWLTKLDSQLEFDSLRKKSTPSSNPGSSLGSQ